MTLVINTLDKPSTELNGFDKRLLNLRTMPFSSENQPAHNPGRPKGSKSATTVLRELINAIAPDEVVDMDFVRSYCKAIKGKPTVKDALAARLAHEAINKGNIQAVTAIYDRLDGKPGQKVELKVETDANTVLLEQLRSLVMILIAQSLPVSEAVAMAKAQLIEWDEQDGLGLDAANNVDALEAEVIASLDHNI